MNRQFIRHMCMFAVLALLGMGPGSFRPVAAQENAPDVEKGVDVLTYGPIHEAFAEAVTFDPEAGIVVPKAPPEAIEEIPPEQKPAGDVEWIPGYWAWDDDRNDFIWVSGIWRVVPPNRQWIPGYWVKSEKGSQWISGYWAAEKEANTEYLPEPPESVEVGPNVNAPSSEYGWIPGCWVWSHGRYAWRPGYWAVMRPNWVWMPAHYVWSPRGYIFVGGYWDFAVGRRGVLFAPVAFGVGVSLVPGFYFTPSFMIDLRIFSDCLFFRPRYHHYYFGDYYGPRYYQRGIFPWFSPHARRHGYDPIYAHQRWEHRHDRNWEKNLNAKYQERRNHEEARPPRSLHDSKRFDHKGMVSKASGRPFKEPFVPVTKSREGMAKFKPLSKNERAQIDQRGKDVRNYGNERLKRESPESARPAAGTPKAIETDKAKLPKSPIAAKPTGPAHTKKAPPDRYKAPQPNRTVEPLQRRHSGAPETSKRIETDKVTSPKSPSASTPPAGPSRPTGPAPTETAPPDRHNAHQPNPRAEPPQGRSSGGGERNIGAKPDNRGNRP